MNGHQCAVRFRDYLSAYDEAKRYFRHPASNRAAEELGFDIKDFESAYAYELREAKLRKDLQAGLRLTSELEWHRSKRPFFNVYPLIEKKFMELPGEIRMDELVMPFPAIEVRTQKLTMLLCRHPGFFLLVIDHKDGQHYQEWIVRLRDTLREFFVNSENGGMKVLGSRTDDELQSVTKELHYGLRLAVGTCMLAADSKILTPVILNAHRKENMTPAEIADYSERAVNRTGRIGFEIGREIERMKATVHYRNGHFAKYYVGKDHESYPKNAEASKVPIIKWRCGSIVNKDNAPKVPTGFKDLSECK
jgi:hypothetical protein